MCNNENLVNTSTSASLLNSLSYCAIVDGINENSTDDHYKKNLLTEKDIVFSSVINNNNNNINNNNNYNNNNNNKSDNNFFCKTNEQKSSPTASIDAKSPNLWNSNVNISQFSSTIEETSIDHQQQQQRYHHNQKQQLHNQNHHPSALVSAPLQRSSIAITTTALSSRIMLGNGVIPPGLLPPLDQYRLQLYNYAMAERLRCSQYHNNGSISMCPPGYPNAAAAAAAAAVNNPYGSRFALSFFHNRVFQPEEPKPQHSYIGLIAMAILSSPESKLVLSDIYQHILDNYPYFRTRGPGWRNSIRHNLSLNDCFIKAGRSANGKGHYWAIHPANIDDFKKGDFRRRKAQRKVRKHMGLAVDDDGTDSPSPPALAVTPPPHPSGIVGTPFCPSSWAAAAVVASGTPTAGVMANIYSQSRKRQFDVASLLAPDEDNNLHHNQHSIRYFQNDHHPYNHHHYHHLLKSPAPKRLAISNSNDIDEYIDVVASDAEDGIRQTTINKLSETLSSTKHDLDDDINCNQSNVPPVIRSSSSSISIEIKNFRQHDDRETQSTNDDSATESPISNHQIDDDIGRNESSPTLITVTTASRPLASAVTTATAATVLPPSSSSPTTWQNLMQQWPNNFTNTLAISGTNAAAAAAAAMDPRILGRYYGQYMAAAAAQQMVASRRVIAVGNLLNNTAITSVISNNEEIKENNSINQNGNNKNSIMNENNSNNENILSSSSSTTGVNNNTSRVGSIGSGGTSVTVEFPHHLQPDNSQLHQHHQHQSQQHHQQNSCGLLALQTREC